MGDKQSISRHQHGNSALEPKIEPSAQSSGQELKQHPSETTAPLVIQAVRSIETTSIPVDPSEPTLAELTALEEENGRLKLVLAEHLREQNLRLKKMLDRFAAS